MQISISEYFDTSEFFLPVKEITFILFSLQNLHAWTIFLLFPLVLIASNKSLGFAFASKNLEKIFIEIKNVTLLRKRGIGEFPDSITTRGSKHIKELVNASRDGYGAYLIFIIQREDCKSFRIARDIDVDYYNTLKKAIKNKLKVLCYDCKFSSKGISINKSIDFKLDD